VEEGNASSLTELLRVTEPRSAQVKRRAVVLIRKLLFPQPKQAVRCPRMRVREGRLVFQTHSMTAFFVNVQGKRDVMLPQSLGK